MSAPTILKKIIARKHQEVAERSAVVPLAVIRAQLPSVAATRGFARSLAPAVAEGRPAVIADDKKASPSNVVIRVRVVQQ